MKPYTVLLLRPDYIDPNFGQDTFLAHVDAEDPCRAQALAQQQAWEADRDEDADEAPVDLTDYHVLFVAEGHLKDLTCSIS